MKKNHLKKGGVESIVGVIILVGIVVVLVITVVIPMITSTRASQATRAREQQGVDNYVGQQLGSQGVVVPGG